MATLIIFLVSLFALCVILLSKYIETRTGHRTFFQKIIDRLNERSTVLIGSIKYRIFQMVQIVRFVFLVKIPEKGRVSYNETREMALREYQKKREVLMGRKVLKNNGSVSFFLKKIKEDSLNKDGGKIEQSL